MRLRTTDHRSPRSYQGFRALMLASVLATLPGCLWIGASEQSERLDQLDEDGDGVLAGDEVQCGPDGDHSPDRSPETLEVKYDGIDNDCDGSDLIDVDGDGYPGISQEEYEETLAGLDPTEASPWPEEAFAGKAKDCNDDPTKGGAAVNPGVLNDLPYSLQDENCDGVNEWDADGDGFVRALGDADGDGVDDGYAFFLQFEANYDYDFPNVQGGDCDDDDENVNPGLVAGDDLPYDGIDADCQGNNDFDADGDGWYPAVYETAFLDYRESFADTVPWYDDRPGDCFDSCQIGDQAPAGTPLPAEADRDGNGLVDFCEPKVAGFPFPQVLPESVNPGATEVYYNGADDDCVPLSDFDADLDGYGKAGLNPTGVSLFYTLWGGDSLATADGDCDDTVPTINPGQLEVIGDQVDQDCYQTPEDDSAVLHIVSAKYWTNPGQIEVGHTDFGWAITVPADDVDELGSATADNVFLLDGIDTGVTRPRTTTILQNRTGVYGGNDLVATSDTLLLGTTFLTAGFHAVESWEYTWNVQANGYLLGPDAPYTIADVDQWEHAADVSVLLASGGRTWTAGCGDGVVYFVEAGGLGRTGSAAGLAGATSCLVEEGVTQEPEITSCSPTRCERYAVSATQPFTLSDLPDNAWSTGKWSRVERHGTALALVPASGDGLTVRVGATSATYFTTEQVLAADAVVHGADTLVAAVVVNDATLDPEVRLLVISKGVVDSDTVLGFDPWTPLTGGAAVTGTPSDVSLEVADIAGQTLILVGATALGPDPADCSVACPGDDQVGWTQLILP